jgi:hypothetical protein
MRPQTGTRREIVEQWKHRLPDSSADISLAMAVWTEKRA